MADQTTETEVAEMFGETDDVKTIIKDLAESIAIEDDVLAKMKSELTMRKDALALAKEKLCNVLRENGMESCKLESGLNPKARSTMKYYKAAGIDDGALHVWLEKNDLADIIIPYVHWQTLNATLKSFEESGGDIDDTVINASMQNTVTLYGKSKFLAGKEG